jgi:hypothetical protein
MKSIYNQIKSFIILFKIYGQFKSIKEKSSIDRNRNEIPWYTYPCIEYLNNIDFYSKSVFEFGSGNSSIYWLKNAKSLKSIESNKDWYYKLKNKQLNLNLLLRNKDRSYENSITESDEKYDVIILDGIRRIECSKIISKYCNYDSSEGYMIILDNSDRHTNICKYFRDHLNLIELDFHGFGPINNYVWTTSVFLSRNFNFKPKGNIQPVKSYYLDVN